MAERRVTVTVEIGLTARIAQLFTRAALYADAPVTVRRVGGEPFDGTDVLMLVHLDIRPGEQIILSGEDEAALDKMVELATSPWDPHKYL
jgi:phosphocarrier protein HPr